MAKNVFGTFIWIRSIVDSLFCLVSEILQLEEWTRTIAREERLVGDMLNRVCQGEFRHREVQRGRAGVTKDHVTRLGGVLYTTWNEEENDEMEKVRTDSTITENTCVCVCMHWWFLFAQTWSSF